MCSLGRVTGLVNVFTQKRPNHITCFPIFAVAVSHYQHSYSETKCTTLPASLKTTSLNMTALSKQMVTSALHQTHEPHAKTHSATLFFKSNANHSLTDTCLLTNQDKVLYKWPICVKHLNCGVLLWKRFNSRWSYSIFLFEIIWNVLVAPRSRVKVKNTQASLNKNPFPLQKTPKWKICNQL